jgi:iron complex outermembrane receptor protein
MSTAVALAILGMAQSTAAQEIPKPQAEATVETFVVTGVRAALQSAARVKRNADQVMDVITAEDVGKLPDANVAEALQRVTGVQVTRVWGEGQSVSIRGLPLVRVEVDGRTVLGYSTRLSPPENDQLGRNSGLDVVPSGMFGRLEVSKSPVASQVEGGLSGTVNMVTPDPLDMKGLTVVAKVQDEYSAAAKTNGPGVTFFVANQSEDRTVGGLFAVEYQKRVSLLQGFDRNDFLNRVASKTVDADMNKDGVADLSGQQIRYEQVMVDRTRLGINGEVQFRLSPEMEFKLEGIYSELKTERRQNWFQWRYGNLPITNPVFVGNSLVAGTASSTISQQGQVRSEPGTTTIVALSNKWKPNQDLRVTSEVSASRGTQNQMNEHMTITSPVVSGNFDYRTGTIPGLVFNNGFDPSINSATNAANKYVVNPTTGTNITSNNLVSAMGEKVVKADVQYNVDFANMRTIHFGVRYRQLEAKANSFEAAGRADLTSFITTTGADFMKDIDGIFPRNALTLNQDAGWIRETVLAQMARVSNKQRDYDFKEKAAAAYAMADFEGKLFDMPFRANAGSRLTSTRMEVDSFTRFGTTYTLRNDSNSYVRSLPSANIVFDVAPDLLVRLASSKTMQQAGIAELSPTIFISGTTSYSAVGGNAKLAPTMSNNVDLSFELYGKGSSLISGALFYKNVADVQASNTVQQNFEGFGVIPYTRPDNVGSAKIKGAELGIQRFFDFLPAPFNNFGTIANFTYTDGLLSNGYQYPGLSKNSGNLVGLYESGPFSARLAYNTRSQAVYIFNEGRPNYIGARSQLDFQAGYNFTKDVSIQFSASNLRPKDSATLEYGPAGPIQLSSYGLSETRYTIGLRAKL